MSAPPAPPRRIRVLHFITHFALGGAERFALDLSAGLAGRIDFGIFAVHGVVPGPLGDNMRRELVDARIPLFSGSRLPLKMGGLVPAALHAAAAVRRFKPDLLHLHTEIPEATAAAMLAFTRTGRSCAIVRTIHNSQYWTYWPRTGRWCDRRLHRARIIGVSRAALAGYESVRLSSDAGDAPAPPEVIYNGVPFSPADLMRPSRRPQSPFRLLFAARLEPQKGADLIPEIARRVRLRAEQQCHLTLYGTGSCEGLLRAFTAAPPSQWTVRLAPPVASLRERLAEFDFVLMPSRFEGLGMLAIEASLLRVPVIATTVAGLDEALPVDYPWLARPDDAVDFSRVIEIALNENHAERERAVNAASLHARDRFDCNRMCTQYEASYRRCLADRRR